MTTSTLTHQPSRVFTAVKSVPYGRLAPLGRGGLSPAAELSVTDVLLHISSPSPPSPKFAPRHICSLWYFAYYNKRPIDVPLTRLACLACAIEEGLKKALQDVATGQPAAGAEVTWTIVHCAGQRERFTHIKGIGDCFSYSRRCCCFKPQCNIS